MSFHVPERYRITTGRLASSKANGNNGAFFVPCWAINGGKSSPPFKVIASDGAMEDGAEPWEHVSVSLPHRCPTWDEMCHIKGLFWDDEDAVMQLHPPRSEWVSNHPFCLHLWRPTVSAIPMPPSLMVGIRELGTIR